MTPDELKDARHKFRQQRKSAKHRGIEFLLTFDEWLQAWLDSGHWYERGRFIGGYVMCREGDVGPYALGNIYFATLNQNAVVGQRGKPKALDAIEKMRKAKTGHPCDAATKAKISASNIGHVQSAETLQKRSASLRAAWAKRKLEQGMSA